MTDAEKCEMEALSSMVTELIRVNLALKTQVLLLQKQLTATMPKEE